MKLSSTAVSSSSQNQDANQWTLVQIVPNQDIIFRSSRLVNSSRYNESMKSTLISIKNQITNKVCFQIKTTNPKIYVVKPSHGVIQPLQKQDIEISLIKEEDFRDDQFKFQVIQIEEEKLYLQDDKDYWKAAELQQRIQQRQLGSKIEYQPPTIQEEQENEISNSNILSPSARRTEQPSNYQSTFNNNNNSNFNSNYISNNGNNFNFKQGPPTGSNTSPPTTFYSNYATVDNRQSFNQNNEVFGSPTLRDHMVTSNQRSFLQEMQNTNDTDKNNKLFSSSYSGASGPEFQNYSSSQNYFRSTTNSTYQPAYIDVTNMDENFDFQGYHEQLEQRIEEQQRQLFSKKQTKTKVEKELQEFKQSQTYLAKHPEAAASAVSANQSLEDQGFKIWHVIIVGLISLILGATLSK